MRNPKHHDEPVPAPHPQSQPPNTRIQFTATPTSLTFLIPRLPLGLTGPSLVLFLAIPYSIYSWSPYSPIPLPKDFFSIEFLLMLFFRCMGPLVTLFYLQFVFQTTVIIATPEQLIITFKGPLRSRELAFPRNTISLIYCIEPRRTSSKSYEPPCLQIYTTQKTVHDFLDAHPLADLKWIAYTLNIFYHLK